jgi:hypothetical protein
MKYTKANEVYKTTKKTFGKSVYCLEHSSLTKPFYALNLGVFINDAWSWIFQPMIFQETFLQGFMLYGHE